MSKNRMEIKHENPLREAGFTQVENIVLRDGSLGARPKALYCVLLSYAWNKNECYPNQETIAEDLGVTRRTVIRWLEELKEYGLIEVVKRKTEDDQFKSNLYIIRDLREVYELSTTHVTNSSHDRVTKLTHDRVTNSSHKEYAFEKDYKSKKTRTRKEKKSKKPPAVIAEKFSQVFNRQLSEELYERMAEYFTDQKILIQALKIAEEKADKPAYLLKILSDWSKQSLDSKDSINTYIQQRKSQNILKAGSGSSGMFNEKAKELMDANKLREREDWN